MKSCQGSISSKNTFLAVPEEDIAVDISACRRTVGFSAHNKLSSMSIATTDAFTGKEGSNIGDSSTSCVEERYPVASSAKSSKPLFKSRPLFQYVSSKNDFNNIETEESKSESLNNTAFSIQSKALTAMKEASDCLSYASISPPSQLNRGQLSVNLSESSSADSQSDSSISQYSAHDYVLQGLNTNYGCRVQGVPSERRTALGQDKIPLSNSTSLEKTAHMAKPRCRVPSYNLANAIKKVERTSCHGLSQTNLEKNIYVTITLMPDEEDEKNLKTFPKEHYTKSTQFSVNLEEQSFFESESSESLLPCDQ